MALTVSNTKFYKYFVDSFYVLIPSNKEPIVINKDQVIGFSIEKDFDENYYPIFRLMITMNPKTYYTIIKNKLDVKFKIRLQKAINVTEGNVEYKEDYLNDIFCIYMDDNTPFVDEKLYDDSKSLKEESGTNLRDFMKDYTFFLFKEDDVNNAKNISNKIISNSNITNALAYLLSSNGYKKVLMAPLHNKNTYEEILLQPITMIGNIEYLEQQYGFYDQGTTIFFDHDRMYIMPKTNKCVVYANKEFTQTVFTIKETGKAEGLSSGCFKDMDAKKFYINIAPNNYTANNDTVISDHIDGNNLLVINPITASVDKIDSQTVQRGSGSYKILINKYNNKLMNSSERSTINETSRTVSVVCSDFDMDAISPNKEFLFIFENKNLNRDFGGLYRMIKQVLEFSKKGSSYHIVATLELRRQTI
jgi:hypothetical protein